MGVVLYVSPIVDPDRGDEDVRKLRIVNEGLSKRGLPRYQDPAPKEANEAFWNVTFKNSCEEYLHRLLAGVQDSGVLTFRHFLDPGQHKISGYIPIDFPEPIVLNFAEEKSSKWDGFRRYLFKKDDPREHEEDLWLVGSCQGLLREIEEFAQIFEIPLERFPHRLKRPGEGKGETSSAVIRDLKEKNARCMRTQWDKLTDEVAEQQFRQFCEMTGVPYEKFRSEMIEEHGSIIAFFERSGTDSDEEKISQAILALVHYWHGCRLAIDRGLLFGIS